MSKYTPPPVIPREDLIVRRVYRVQARNLTQAVWNGKDFLGIREKFGSRFIDGCEVPYATCFPLEDLGIDVPETISVEEYLGSIDRKTGRPVDFDRPIAQGGRGWYFTDTNRASKNIRSMAKGNPQLYGFMEALLLTLADRP